MTMTLVSTVTVGAGGSSSITFSAIAGTATDLLLVYSLRSNRASADNDNPMVNFNSDTGSNYSIRWLRGNGSAASSFGTTTTFLYGGNTTATVSTASTFANAQMYIPNYAGSTSKSISIDSVNENNDITAYASINAGLWTGTAAITSITIAPQLGTLWEQYSTASLYTITKGSGGATVA